MRRAFRVPREVEAALLAGQAGAAAWQREARAPDSAAVLVMVLADDGWLHSVHCDVHHNVVGVDYYMCVSLGWVSMPLASSGLGALLRHGIEGARTRPAPYILLAIARWWRLVAVASGAFRWPFWPRVWGISCTVALFTARSAMIGVAVVARACAGTLCGSPGLRVGPLSLRVHSAAFDKHAAAARGSPPPSRWTRPRDVFLISRNPRWD